MTDDATNPIVYVDANPFIYFVDGEGAIANGLKSFFEFLRQKPGIAMTSELTLAEVLPKARSDTRGSYLNLIVWSGLFNLQPIMREILVDTADYRRINSKILPGGRSVMPKLPDAIHVVTAARHRCRMFLSADAARKLPADIAAFEPNEVGLSKLMHELS
jgi:predicted nucleic acid-binding protein